MRFIRHTLCALGGLAILAVVASDAQPPPVPVPVVVKSEMRDILERMCINGCERKYNETLYLSCLTFKDEAVVYRCTADAQQERKACIRDCEDR